MTKHKCAQLYIWRISQCAKETIYGEIIHDTKSTWCWATPFLQRSCLRQHAESTTGTGAKPPSWFDVVPFMSEAHEQYVRTVDGQDVPSEQAHRLCKKSTELSAFPASVKCIAFITFCGDSLLCRLCWPSMALVRECLADLARS